MNSADSTVSGRERVRILPRNVRAIVLCVTTFASDNHRIKTNAIILTHRALLHNIFLRREHTTPLVTWHLVGGTVEKLPLFPLLALPHVCIQVGFQFASLSVCQCQRCQACMTLVSDGFYFAVPWLTNKGRSNIGLAVPSILPGPRRRCLIFSEAK